MTVVRTLLDATTEIPFPQDRDKAEDGVEARAVVAAAGIRRFVRASGLESPGTLNSDRIKVKHVLMWAGLKGDALKAAIAQAEEAADSLMEDPERWREVEALTDALLATESVLFRLDGPKASAVIRGAQFPRIG